jgi:hypothetical protein
MGTTAPTIAAGDRLAWTSVDWARQRAEPYRLLFPLGTLLAVAGMGIWIPYAIWPAAVGYPGQGHAALQIQGFLMSFIFGFLTTMLPKVLGVRPLGPVAYGLLPLCLIGSAVSALAGAPALTQAFHLALLADFLVFVLSRFPRRRAQPPPPFVFIAAAMLADLGGTVLRLGALLGFFGGPALRAAAALQYQAFPLLLIVGVGGFLLPKLFAQGPIDPRSLAARAPGLPGFRGQAALCLALLASYGIEIGGLYAAGGEAWLRIAYGLRTAVWAWFLWREIRLQKTPGKLPPYLRAARISLWVMGAGLAMPIFRPQYMLAWEHVIFLSGFMRLTLSIAARVLAAHAGRMEILGLHARQVRIYGMLIVLAMMTRIATEIWPGGRALHLAVAAALGLVALRMWARLFLPLVRVVPGR